MPRIRTIKPTFWTSTQVVKCSRDARLLFIGLWNFCDDDGVHPADLLRLKMEVFPADNIDIAPLINELEKAGLIEHLTADGNKQFWKVTGWRHQKINRISKVKWIVDPSSILTEHSLSTHEALTEHSLTYKYRDRDRDKDKDKDKVIGQNDGSHLFPPSPIPAEIQHLELYCVDKKLCERLPELMPAWKLAFPGIDIPAEIAKAHSWEIANPAKRKRDRPRFLQNWLNRAQDRGGQAPQRSYNTLEDLPKLRAQLFAAKADVTHWQEQVRLYGDKHSPKVKEAQDKATQLMAEVKRLEGVR